MLVKIINPQNIKSVEFIKGDTAWTEYIQANSVSQIVRRPIPDDAVIVIHPNGKPFSVELRIESLPDIK